MKASAALIALVFLGCGGPRGAEGPHDQTELSDDTACAHLCAKLASCGRAPNNCVAGCERDRARLREGVEASFVACVERELRPPACSASPSVEGDSSGLRQTIGLCYSATLEAYGARDAGASLRRVLIAMCGRRARCSATKVDQQACIVELEAQTKGGAASKILAVGRQELVERVATCVAARPCEEEGAVEACLQTIDPEAPEAKAK